MSNYLNYEQKLNVMGIGKLVNTESLCYGTVKVHKMNVKITQHFMFVTDKVGMTVSLISRQLSW